MASSRLRIARLAAEAAVAVPGVLHLPSGPRRAHVTGGAGDHVDGVVVAAVSDGRYEVDLHLVCALVALPALADRVRAAVLAASTTAGLQEEVGPVHIHIEDIANP